MMPRSTPSSSGRSGPASSPVRSRRESGCPPCEIWLWTELERDGLVYSQRTSGRYVTEDQTAIMEARHALAADRVRSFLTDMERLGFEKEDLLSLLRQESEKE